MTLAEQAGPAKAGIRAKIVEEFEALTRLHGLQGPVLEILRGPRRAAISLSPFLGGFERHVVAEDAAADVDGTQFHKGNPNDLSDLFDDGVFSTVIWDRGLEQDPQFWLTLGEIKRVLAPGGALMVCTRGFAKNNRFGIKVVGANGNTVPFLSATCAVSPTGADYLRFSPQGLRNVVLRGLDVLEVRSSFMVPHLFAVARKPA